jgi:hypothetical protein
MGKLVTLVSRSPSLLLGHSVARLPRLRVGASQEAWLITAVRLAKGGGNPKVYGMRYSLGASKGLEFLDTKGREIHGPLKGDWTSLFSPPGGVLGEGSVVRSPVALCLSPELEGKAVRLEAPYDTLKDSLLARASKERELHMKAVLARAAGAPLEEGAGPAGGAEEGAAVQGGDAAGSPAAGEAPPAEAAATPQGGVEKRSFKRRLDIGVQWVDPISGATFCRTPYRALVTGLSQGVPWQVIHSLASEVGEVTYAHAGEVPTLGWCALVEVEDSKTLSRVVQELVRGLFFAHCMLEIRSSVNGLTY